MKSLLTFSALILLYIIASCDTLNTSHTENPSSGYTSGDLNYGSTSTMSNGHKKHVPIDRKIIWTGNLELQVSNVDIASRTIDSLCSKYNAFVSKMKLTNNRHEISNRITIRVSNKDFNNLVSEIKGQSIYTKKVEITSNDVSEEFVDIEGRLKTKKEVRERYINILKTKTGDIKDVIEAEEAIRKITEEIEAKEGRLRFLKDQVSFSTVNLELFQKVKYENVPEVYEKSFLAKSSDALKNGWSIVTELFYGLLNIWPLIILISLLIWRSKSFLRRIGLGSKYYSPD